MERRDSSLPHPPTMPNLGGLSACVCRHAQMLESLDIQPGDRCVCHRLLLHHHVCALLALHWSGLCKDVWWAKLYVRLSCSMHPASHLLKRATILLPAAGCWMWAVAVASSLPVLRSWRASKAQSWGWTSSQPASSSAAATLAGCKTPTAGVYSRTVLTPLCTF